VPRTYIAILKVQPHPTVNKVNEPTAIGETSQGHSISEHSHPYRPTPTRGQARQEHVNTKSLGKSTDASCLHFHNTEEPSRPSYVYDYIPFPSFTHTHNGDDTLPRFRPSLFVGENVEVSHPGALKTSSYQLIK